MAIGQPVKIIDGSTGLPMGGSDFGGSGGEFDAQMADDLAAIRVEAESTDPVPVEDANVPTPAVVDFTWTVDSTALAAGDVIVTAAAEIAGFFTTSTSYTRISSLLLHDADDVGAAIDIYFQNAGTSLGTQNGAPSITDANGEVIIGVVPVDTANYYDLGAFKKAFVSADQIPHRLLKGGGASTSVWITGVVRGAATYAGAALKLKIAIERFD